MNNIFDSENRPLRLIFSNQSLNQSLIIQYIEGVEQVNGDFRYIVRCVSGEAGLELKNMISTAVSIHIVTDKGELHRIHGLIFDAMEGQSDGGLSIYQLTIVSALSFMDKRIKTKVFHNLNLIEITQKIFKEYNDAVPSFGLNVKLNLDKINFGTTVINYEKRAQVFQHGESDTAFLKRLWKKHGINWFIREDRSQEDENNLAHEIVLINNNQGFSMNKSAKVKYHRIDGTEEADSINLIAPFRQFTAGEVRRKSHDYAGAKIDKISASTQQSKYSLSDFIQDEQISSPHEGGSSQEFQHLTQFRMQHYDLTAKHFYLESSVRTLRAGEFFEIENHHEFDNHATQERDLIILEMRMCAKNNLPKDLNDRITRLFKSSGWENAHIFPETDEDNLRYHNKLVCSRLTMPVVPEYNPNIELPKLNVNHAVVVSSENPDDPQTTLENDEVVCDEKGRVKIQLHGYDQATSWVRVASSWAGHQWGAIYLPRLGQEVVIDFDGNDPDKFVIIGRVHNADHLPPNFSHSGSLPGNRYLAGIKSKENKSSRYNQLRFDDTTGQINAQIASEHGYSQLNLGWLTHPRKNGESVPRGEGAELRTDESLALRSGKAMLLTAWGKIQAQENQLTRSELNEMVQACAGLTQALHDYACQHQALNIDLQPLEQLKQHILNWENGSNIKSASSQDGGKRVLAATAEHVIVLATPQNLMGYAANHQDWVAGLNIQVTAGKNYTVTAQNGISLFAQKGGAKIIAHQQPLLLQSQFDKTQINALKDVEVTSKEGNIVCSAKEIHLIAQDGSFIKIGNGITIGTMSTFLVKASSHVWTGPDRASYQIPNFEKSDKKGSLKLHHFYDSKNLEGVAAGKYEVIDSEGVSHKGELDQEGKASINNIALGGAKILFHKESRNPNDESNYFKDIVIKGDTKNKPIQDLILQGQIKQSLDNSKKIASDLLAQNTLGHKLKDELLNFSKNSLNKDIQAVLPKLKDLPANSVSEVKNTMHKLTESSNVISSMNNKMLASIKQNSSVKNILDKVSSPFYNSKEINPFK